MEYNNLPIFSCRWSGHCLPSFTFSYKNWAYKEYVGARPLHKIHIALKLSQHLQGALQKPASAPKSQDGSHCRGLERAPLTLQREQLYRASAFHRGWLHTPLTCSTRPGVLPRFCGWRHRERRPPHPPLQPPEPGLESYSSCFSWIREERTPSPVRDRPILSGFRPPRPHKLAPFRTPRREVWCPFFLIHSSWQNPFTHTHTHPSLRAKRPAGRPCSVSVGTPPLPMAAPAAEGTR